MYAERNLVHTSSSRRTQARHRLQRATLRVEALEERNLLDVGDTLGTSFNTAFGPGPGSYTSAAERVGDGTFLLRDVDLYVFQATANLHLTARTAQPSGGRAADTMLRVFSANGQELAFNDDCVGAGLYSCVNNFVIPTTGTYYVGISAYSNRNYNPNQGGSGIDANANAVGDFQLSLLLETDSTDPDIGDTLATAEVTNLGPAPGVYTLATQPIGNGAFGNRDVDLFRFQANAGLQISVRTSYPSGGTPMDTMVRLFNAQGTQLALNDDCASAGDLYSCIENFGLPGAGTYYLGVSGYNNGSYNPNTGGSGTAGSTGDYRLQLTLGTAPRGELRGQKYYDFNANGIKEEGEPGMENWFIFLDQNQNNSYDPDEVWTMTDVNGNYVFTDLPAGTYTVAEYVYEGWYQTAPGYGGTIEDFETGNLDKYRTMIRYRPTAEVVTYNPLVGNYSLRDLGKNDWIIRDDAPVQVRRGDFITAWVYLTETDGRAYFAFGATPQAVNGPLNTGSTLSLVLAPNTNQLVLQENLAFDYRNLGAVPQTYGANQWYYLEVEWGLTGQLTGRLYDSSINLLNTVTGNSTAITRGGIGFRATGSDKYWDYVSNYRGLPFEHTVTLSTGQTVADLDFGNYWLGGAPGAPRTKPVIKPNLTITPARQLPAPVNPNTRGIPLPFGYVSMPNTNRDIQMSAIGNVTQIVVNSGRVAVTFYNESFNVSQLQVGWGPIVRGLFGSDIPVEHPHLQSYLYRLRPTENAERIGESDLKHFFSSGNVDYQHLRPGQRDTYSTGHNSDQSLYGPTNAMDPVTGELVAGHAPHMATVDVNGVDAWLGPQQHGPLDHRLTAAVADLDPAQSPTGTRWFLSAMLFVHGDQNINDNSRWIEIRPSWNGTSFTFTIIGSTTGTLDIRTMPGLVPPGPGPGPGPDPGGSPGRGSGDGPIRPGVQVPFDPAFVPALPRPDEQAFTLQTPVMPPHQGALDSEVLPLDLFFALPMQEAQSPAWSSPTASEALEVIDSAFRFEVM